MWMLLWACGFRKTRGISWLAEDLLASQKGLCSVELVSSLVTCFIKVQSHARRFFKTQSLQDVLLEICCQFRYLCKSLGRLKVPRAGWTCKQTMTAQVKRVMNEVRWWWVFLVCLCVYYIVLQKNIVHYSLLFHGYCKIARYKDLNLQELWCGNVRSRNMLCCQLSRYSGSIPWKGRIFFLFESVQNGSGAHWPPLVGSFPWDKEAGARSWPSSYGAEVKNARRCASIPLCNFLVCMGKILPFVLSRMLALSNLRINSIPNL